MALPGVTRPVLAALEFTATLIEWRGPAPFLFAPVPDELTPEIRFAAREASYGWGVVPVTATIGGTTFTTSLFPRGGGYLLPIKVAVQRAEALGVGDAVAVAMTIPGR
jgi:hypothetical protein